MLWIALLYTEVRLNPADHMMECDIVRTKMSGRPKFQGSFVPREE